MKIIFSVLGMHKDLTDMAIGFYRNLPIEIIIERGPKHFHEFEVQYRRLGYNADFVVGLDEDCFIYRPQSVMDLIAHMEKNGIAFCGMPEGGVSQVRHFNPRYMNSFFNIFNVPLISRIGLDRKTVENYENDKSLNERYWAIFAFLKDSGLKFFNITGEDHSDGITTILRDHRGKGFLMHAWYARDWDKPETRERIMEVYRDAIRRKIDTHP